MGKRLAPMIAVLAMLAPVAAYALGLGDITMKSALNQPLDAEIELLSVQKGDLDDLHVKLGSVEDFARVGADRSFFLSKIKFDVAQRPDGTPYIRLRTTELVTEPFLDFVVEARWPRGRILREYTVLVDPPVVSEETPAPIQQAAVQQQAPAAAVISRQPPIRARAELSPVQQRDGALSYGPVRRNDTLWVIANRMRPDESVTVNQMMLALVRENPQAFYNGNVNQLKAGYVLRIEDPASITALSPAQADAEVERQRVEWEARKSGRPLRQVAGAETAAPTAGPAAGGEAAATAEARLKLVAPGSEGTGSGTGDADVERLRQDLVLAAEALDANRQETEELKARLAQMEEQLAAMQRLIMLKDDEMLALQKQLSGEVEEPGAGEESALIEEAPAEEATETAETAETGAEAEAPAAPTQAAKAPEAPKPAVPAPVVAPPPAEPSLLENPLLMYGGIGVVVLAIVGWIMARRRKMQEGFQESILNVGGGDAAEASSEMTPGVGGESSMVSDFAMSEISDMSGIQTDATEVDPISEADVYLAYGRHQQAEDIIRSALENEPQRTDLKAKLLEVFFAAKNSAAFESEAQELRDALGDESDPVWAKVVTMGSQLCPDSPLFGGASQSPQAEMEEAAATADDDLLDFDFDLDSADLGSGETKARANEFDAELDQALAGEAGSAEEAEAAAAADTGLDFDVSTLDFNLDQSTAEDEADEVVVAAGEEEEAKPAVTDDETDALDFDMESLDKSSVTTESEAPEEEPATESKDASAGLDFDLAETLDAAALSAEDVTSPEATEGEALDLDVEVAGVENALEFEAIEAGEAGPEGEEADLQLDMEAAELELEEDEAIEFDAAAGSEGEAEVETLDFEEAAEPAEEELNLSGLELEEAGVTEEAPAEEQPVEEEALAKAEPAEEEPAEEEPAEMAEEAETEAHAEGSEGETTAADALDDELLDEDIFGEVDEIGTKLDLAKAYVDMGDGDGARSILDEVLEEGDDDQKQQAKELLDQLG